VGVAGPYELKAGCDAVNRRAGILEKAGMTVAKVIDFYIPRSFRRSVKWVSREQRGKIIEFASPIKKSA
jgi:hypothetical protein